MVGRLGGGAAEPSGAGSVVNTCNLIHPITV